MCTMKNSVMMMGRLYENPTIGKNGGYDSAFQIIVYERDRKPMMVKCLSQKKPVATAIQRLYRGDQIAIDGSLRIDNEATWIEVHEVFPIGMAAVVANEQP